LFLSGKVRQLQHPPPPPPPPVLMPVKAALTPQTGQNKTPLGKAVKAKAVNSLQATPVNPFSKAAKGMERDTQYYIPPID